MQNHNPFDPKTGQAIADMINAFLRWPLPKSVRSDGCCTMSGYPHPRYGTNLMSLPEAMQMMQEVVCPIIADHISDSQKSVAAVEKRVAELETYRDICNAQIKADEAEFDRLNADFARELERALLDAKTDEANKADTIRNLMTICDNLRRGASENGEREARLRDEVGRAGEEHRNINYAYQQLSEEHGKLLHAQESITRLHEHYCSIHRSSEMHGVPRTWSVSIYGHGVCQGEAETLAEAAAVALAKFDAAEAEFPSKPSTQ